MGRGPCRSIDELPRLDSICRSASNGYSRFSLRSVTLTIYGPPDIAMLQSHAQKLMQVAALGWFARTSRLRPAQFHPSILSFALLAQSDGDHAKQAQNPSVDLA
ncbi:hypothetical protein BKA81DRAFT_146134 [Phyllosticta paracitricarpa]